MSELRNVKGECYFLEVSDDVMSGAGIRKGHRALIDPKSEIEDGDIVLAAIEGEGQAHLRHYFREEGKVILLEDNTVNRPRVLDPQAVRIFGKMLWGKYYPRK